MARQAPGKHPRPDDAQRQALAALVESGPIPALHGSVRWRLIDLAQWLHAEFAIWLHKTTLSRELKKPGPLMLAARPRHPAQDTEALEALGKGALQPGWKSFARASHKARRQKHGVKTRRAQVRKTRSRAGGPGAGPAPAHRMINEPCQPASSGQSARPRARAGLVLPFCRTEAPPGRLPCNRLPGSG